MATRRPRARPLQVARFLAEVQASELTKRQYRKHLERYLGPWLKKHRIGLEQLTWAQFLEFIQERGWGYSAAKQCQSAVRKILQWAGIKGHPLQLQTLHRVEAQKGFVLRPEDLSALDRARSAVSDIGGRDWAMLLTSFHSALRCRELVGLQVGDLNFAESKLYVRSAKSGRREDAPFPPEAQLAVRHYLDHIRSQHARHTDALWIGIGGRTRGQGLTEAGWRGICRRWGQLAGVPRFSPHSCRRGFAHFHTRRGLPTALVMAAGRWRDFRSFQRYQLDLDLDDFLAAVALQEGKPERGQMDASQRVER